MCFSFVWRGRKEGRGEKAHVVWKRDGGMDGWMDGYIEGRWGS